MRILGIETSCDETAIAIIEMSHSRRSGQASYIKILSNIVLSQVPLHRKFGGVVPNLAKREHQRNLVPVLLRALKEADLLQSAKRKAQSARRFAISDLRLAKILEREPELFARIREYILPLEAPDIDAIAVTVGPGLEPALWAGVNFARSLSYMWKRPIIPVNHLEGHVYTVLLGNNPSWKHKFQLVPLKLPALTLVVSGGHTALALMKKFGSYSIIGETRDDAAGEAFDKVARLLGLGYPGGPEIARYASRFQVSAEGGSASGGKSSKLKVSLPRPMLHTNDFDFSFSGLKTAVLYLLQDLRKKYSMRKLRAPIAKEFQEAVVEVLVAKTIRAAKKYRVKSVIIGGGVAANKLLRETLGEKIKKDLPQTAFCLPHVKFTGDNALMIALAAYFSGKKKAWQNIHAKANLRLDKRAIS